MKVIGLTGGIASGKSLVAGMLRELGAEIIDADAVAREVVGAADVRGEIAAAFGPTVVRPDGTLERDALAARIFGDADARAALNAITHPRIRLRILDEVAVLRARRPDATVVLDIPLLLDVAPASAYPLDGIIVVFVDEATQTARLTVRHGMTTDAVRLRLRAQRPLREKLAEATWVIDNSASPEVTRQQVEALWRTWQDGRKVNRAGRRTGPRTGA